MQTKVSTKGQVVLPHPLRRKLGLRPGDALDAKIQSESIVLTPRRSRTRKARVVVDPLTGLPVLTAGPEAAPFSSKQVEEIFASFPSDISSTSTLWSRWAYFNMNSISRSPGGWDLLRLKACPS